MDSLINLKSDQFKSTDYLTKYNSARHLEIWKSIPNVHVAETESSYHFELKMPGYIKEDFYFYFNRGDLIVTTERSEIKKAYNQAQDKNGRHSYCYPSAYFKRRFPLPNNIVKDKIFVDYKNEVLSFVLYKKMH